MRKNWQHLRLKEKYVSTESLLKERYVAIDKVYLKPAVKFVNEQYVVLDSKYFQPAKAYVSDKYVLMDTKFIEQFKTFAETSVLYPTKEFVKGLSQELKWTQRYTSYIPEATQVKEYVAYGYKAVQSNVLLPTASYLGVDETFVSYEKMVLDHVSRVVDPYVSIDGESKKTLTEEDVDGAIIDDAGDALPLITKIGKMPLLNQANLNLSIHRMKNDLESIWRLKYARTRV